MSNLTYEVVMIRRGKEIDYYNYWRHNNNQTPMGEELHTDLLSFTIQVEAPNKSMAEEIAHKKYPDHTIDREATNKIG
ncbi:hypothetical protein [Desulfolutivibrio sp.]|uniref:hypothetical protein n=1 Tax=Desulfolutivibrio sp. TaxID=2773296 RepID=UPI002F96DE9A